MVLSSSESSFFKKTRNFIKCLSLITKLAFVLLLLSTILILFGIPLSLFSSFWGASEDFGNIDANLLELRLNGEIASGTSVDKLLDDMNTALEDEVIKGVLLRINSPGGEVGASSEIAYAIKRLAAKKPVVVYAENLMVSGSYYAGIWATHIMANPAAMVGSIGVIMSGFDVSELLENFGVKPKIYQKGRYKSVASPFKEDTPEEQRYLESTLEDIYQLFVSDVAKARALDPNAAEEYADAQIFIASKAKEQGLIDSLGLRYDAQELLVELSGVDEPSWFYFKEDKLESWLEKFVLTTAKGFVRVVHDLSFLPR